MQLSVMPLTSAADANRFFNNVSGAKPNIDSGIVLTNGRAKTLGSDQTDGNGITTAADGFGRYI